jgi:hypothetical protein
MSGLCITHIHTLTLTLQVTAWLFTAKIWWTFSLFWIHVGNKLIICYYGLKDQDLLSKGPTKQCQHYSETFSCLEKTSPLKRLLWWDPCFSINVCASGKKGCKSRSFYNCRTIWTGKIPELKNAWLNLWFTNYSSFGKYGDDDHK